ncbi:MAG: DUF2027 domain-containing protein, partial [Verrucomicrobia bacterium]|nr:DUF2027 domain-containing protein [Cytophagales bacterium]
MNIGDRVRLLRGTEEGIIRKFLTDKLVEVEIEDGFSIPVMRNEIVLIAAEEAVAFKSILKKTATNISPSALKTQLIADRGVFLAFVSINDQKLSLHLVNNTEYAMPFALFQEEGANCTGLQAGILEKRSEIKIHDASMQNFEKWGAYIFQALFFRQGYVAVKEPFIRKIRFKAGNFFKHRGMTPILEKEAYLFQLDEENFKIEPQAIIERMFGETTENNNFSAKIQPVFQAEVDLHIEKLQADFSKLSNAEILQIQ